MTVYSIKPPLPTHHPIPTDCIRIAFNFHMPNSTLERVPDETVQSGKGLHSPSAGSGFVTPGACSLLRCAPYA